MREYERERRRKGKRNGMVKCNKQQTVGKERKKKERRKEKRENKKKENEKNI